MNRLRKRGPNAWDTADRQPHQSGPEATGTGGNGAGFRSERAGRTADPGVYQWTAAGRTHWRDNGTDPAREVGRR
jgi:hypothetical protein